MTKMEELLDQAGMDAMNARLAAQDIQDGPNRDYVLCVARQQEQRSWGLRKLAWLA